METVEAPDGYYERCRWLVSKSSSARSIVDVGSADGFMFRDVAKDKTVFVDVSPEAGRKCKGLNFCMADAHNLSFRDKCFEAAVLGDILEHVQDPVQVLREAKRVADSLYITVPNEYEWSEDKKPFQTPYHIRFYSLETLKKDLDEALGGGYRIVKIRGGGWSFFCVEWHRGSPSPEG